MATPQQDLAREIHAALECEPRINLHRTPIRVAHVDGGVMLEGVVDDLAVKRLAPRLAARVNGGIQVIDGLRVATGGERGDGEIRDSFARALQGQRDLANCKLSQRANTNGIELVQEAPHDAPSGDVLISASAGCIHIVGHVISLSHKRLIEVLAWWTPGCSNVSNRLEVTPAEEDNDDELADAVRQALEMDPMLDADQVLVRASSGVVTLSGAARGTKESRIAEMDAWAVCGVGEVRNELRVVQ
jgi:osmotically-inducible protein OsmY